ncbi:MAG: hypothetical protein P4L81_08310 [Candidatus Pacebacteria bacterium]|nr:hypothetical protein [Candidatus Paceibacterota bacterium]
MYPEKKVSLGLVALIVGVILILAILFLHLSSSSNVSSPVNQATSSSPDASSSITQALQFAQWLAKEYPAQGQ